MYIYILHTNMIAEGVCGYISLHQHTPAFHKSNSLTISFFLATCAYRRDRPRNLIPQPRKYMGLS